MNGDYGAPDGAQDDAHSSPDAAYNALMTRARGALEASGDLSPSECCLLYTSPSPRDATLSRMPSSA